MVADAKEIDALIDQAIAEADDEFAAPVLAAKLLALLWEEHGDALDAWLHDHAELFLTRELSRRLREVGTKPRLTKARRFAEDAAQGPAAVSSWYERAYVIDAQHNRKRACDMTGADHRFVASQYAASSKTAKMLEAFHTAVSKRLKPAQRCSEVMDSETYDALRISILNAA